jgi:hypothetical protein
MYLSAGLAISLWCLRNEEDRNIRKLHSQEMT